MKDIVIVFWHYQMGDCRHMHLLIELLNKDFSIEEISHHFDLNASNKEKLQQYREEARNITALYTAQNIYLLTIFDQDYPESLRSMPFPPLVLSYKGNLQLLVNKRVTFVAEDNLSYYAGQVIDDMLPSLKSTTLVLSILFDMTRYVYDYAQRHKLPCILLLESGFARQFPIKHLFLEQHACKTGLLISAYPLDVSFNKACLLWHRQLLVGLSSLVCVLECMENSSHVLNAYLALEQNKDVIVPPHNLFKKGGVGANALIQQGARIYLAPVDLQEALEDSY